MFKLMCMITASVFIIAACSPAQEEVLPTLVTLSDTAENPPDEATTEAPADAPVESAAGDDSLSQTIESETGVTYQLPAGWAVQDSASVSNFGSDEDAAVDAISGDSERVNRWMVLGSVGTTTANDVTRLAEVTSFDEAADLLHEHYYTSGYNLVSPRTL